MDGRDDAARLLFSWPDPAACFLQVSPADGSKPSEPSAGSGDGLNLGGEAGNGFRGWLKQAQAAELEPQCPPKLKPKFM
jgi:hypothetical protein